MTVLSSPYGIIIDSVINTYGHGKNVVDGINLIDKPLLKEQMKPIGKLSSNDTSNIRMIASSSKDLYIKFVDQCMHIINNKEE